MICQLTNCKDCGIINKKTNDWNIYIDKDELLPLNVFEQLQDNRHLLDENSNNISIIFNISETLQA